MRAGLSPVSSLLFLERQFLTGETDLKEWLDTHGIAAPQPTTRDKLIASVRRNARVASLRMSDASASASKSASDATDALSDKLLDAWSDSRKLALNGINIK
jgi:hypothetical protein